MSIKCDLCKQDTGNNAIMCCEGSRHSIECGCGGQPVNEEQDYYCSECLEAIEKLQEHGCTILQGTRVLM